ncbi:odontogenesis associated phosphoprotein [Callospermophilus lateralis]|uniref:odontogenesis associated phosphoprotein n=1 Tax=Callospermophilus lateralis TaxID=76772 RepID=UPI004053A103
MAHRPCFTSWSLVCWLVVAVAEETLQTARSSHSPLHPPRGIRQQGSSPLLGHPNIPSVILHKEGLESILGFKTDIFSLQGATTVSTSNHFSGHMVVLILVDISLEEISRVKVHLKKAERKEKPKYTEAKRANVSKNMKIFLLSLSKLKLLD